MYSSKCGTRPSRKWKRCTKPLGGLGAVQPPARPPAHEDLVAPVDEVHEVQLELRPGGPEALEEGSHLVEALRARAVGKVVGHVEYDVVRHHAHHGGDVPAPEGVVDLPDGLDVGFGHEPTVQARAGAA